MACAGTSAQDLLAALAAYCAAAPLRGQTLAARPASAPQPPPANGARPCPSEPDPVSLRRRAHGQDPHKRGRASPLAGALPWSSGWAGDA
jgi:hypothetical protein